MGARPKTKPVLGSPRILVIRPDRIGDVVLTTPLIRALRQTYPGAHLAALIRPCTRAVLEGNPHLNRILVDDPGGVHGGLRGFLSLAAVVRSEDFAISLMVLPTRRHALLTLLAGIPTRVAVGKKPYEVLTGSKPAGRNRDRPVRHEADYGLDLGREIGVDTSDLTPQVFLSDQEKQEARRRLESAGIGPGAIVGVHPGSGGSAPNWEFARYRTLVERLASDLRVWVVVTGEEKSGERWGVGGEAGRRIVDFSGLLSLRELMGILAACDLFVSSSTGPMHLAASLNVTCVALFCPRTACCPARWGPIGEGHRVLLPSSSRCEACGRVRDPTCRLDDISVGEVLTAVEEAVA